jgi:hypothetical protein
LTFSPGLAAPVNPFHTREFTAPELTDLLGRCGFAIETVFGVHAGPRLRALDTVHGGLVAAQLAAPPEDWSERLRADVAAIGTGDFAVVTADVHRLDESLDLLVLARRPF